MRKTFSLLYTLLRWLILLLLFLLGLLYFLLESPSVALDLLKSPLKEQGISYGKIEGGLLSGFTLSDVNYKEQVTAKEVALKVDLQALQNRVLKIDNLVLKDAYIDKAFLASLIDVNSSEEKPKEGNVSLPFDRVLVSNADISLQNIVYDNYDLYWAKLHIDNLDTDMKQKHKGSVTLALDSNVSKLDLKGSFENENYDLVANVDGKKAFLATFVKDANVTLLSNPSLSLKAKGDLEALDYEVKVHRLDATQNEYEMHSRHLSSVGRYHIVKKDLTNKLKSNINSNVGELHLDADTSLNLDDLNNTLRFRVNGDFAPKESHLVAGLSEQNISIEQFPKLKLFAKGDMKDVAFKVAVKGLKATQNGMRLNLKDFDAKGSAKPLDGDVNVVASTLFASSVADGKMALSSTLNFNDLNNSLVFDVKSDLALHGAFLNPYLEESNVTLNGESKLKLTAKGDMNHVVFSTLLKDVQGKQNDIAFHLKDLDLKGTTSPLQGDTDVKLLTHFDSSVSDGFVDLSSKLNFNDLNNSLVFDLKSDLEVHNKFLNPMLQESNVTLKGESSLTLKAKGSMKKVAFTTLFKGLKGQQNEIAFDLKDMALEGEVNPLQGDSDVKLLTHFGSSVADGALEGSAKLNFNNIEESLVLDSRLKVDAHAKYLNPLLKEQELAVQGQTPIVLTAKGSFDNMLLNLDANAKVLKDGKLSSVTVHSSPIKLNLKTNHVEGALNIVSDGEALGVNLVTKFSGDYTKPKEMQIENKIDVNNFQAFGLDLSSLKPLALDVQNKEGGLVVNLNSPKINLVAKSSDNDHFTFKLHTDEIVLSKILKELPEELKGKAFKLDIEGDATVSKQYFNVKGIIASAEGFTAHIDAKNSDNGLDAKLFTQHFKLVATGDIESKNIQAKISIDSLAQVQEEFVTLYPFEIVEVDGALAIEATLRGEDVDVQLSSNRVRFADFRIEDVMVDANYAKELVTINTLNFRTRGFADKSLNEDFYLNQKGLVHLGTKRDVLLDMHPNIKIEATGTKDNLVGDFKIKKLPLGHPEYGAMVLSCDVHYNQYGLKKELTGDIRLDKMKLFYEAKFLDADYDPDVVVLTKKDKKKKKERDSFLEDTFIDLAIYAPSAKYKTRDIDLEFTVDVNAKKEFGFNLGMLGKIKEINGQVIQAPKLFNVVDSTIIFGGGKEINPLLDIQVDYELPDVLISILIHGHANRPKLDFTSEPPLPKKDILSYLLLGVSTAALGEGKGSLGREAQLFIMNQAARDLAYEVELDRVLIKDDGTGEGYAVQVGKKVNDKTMFVIENSKEGNSFILEYEVNKHLKVEVGQHQKTVPSQSIDLYFRKRFK